MRLKSTLFTLVALVAFTASCATGSGDDVGLPNMPENPDDNDDPGGPEPDPDPEPTNEPDPEPALPPCDGVSESYSSTTDLAGEVQEYFGPNVSILLPDNDVVVFYPSSDDYGPGSFNLVDDGEWVIEFCVNWDSEEVICEGTLYSAAGMLTITELAGADALTETVSGSFTGVVFVDDLDNPTCGTRVDGAFAATATE